MKWEYWSIHLSGTCQSEWAKALDEQGKKNWELMGILKTEDAMTNIPSRYLCVFKRPVVLSKRAQKRIAAQKISAATERNSSAIAWR